MKTININLIGDLSKNSSINRLSSRKNHTENKKNVIIISVLAVGCVIFLAGSVGTLVLSNMFGKKLETELTSLKTEHKTLQEERIKLLSFRKSLKKEKKMAEQKLLAKNQINALSVPWGDVLKDIAYKIPKDITVININQKGGIKSNNNVMLDISGIVSAQSILSSTNTEPLTAIAFFILNINEDKDSLLQNAKIRNIQYDNQANFYEFNIETKVISKKNEEVTIGQNL